MNIRLHETFVGRDGASLSVDDPTWVEILGFVAFIAMVLMVSSPWWRKDRRP